VTIGHGESAPRARRRWLFPAAIAALLLVLAAPWLLARLGHWLVVQDPLAPADAIFVHAGHLPFRAMEAADIYRQGFAPEVWLAPIAPTEESEAIRALGIAMPPDWYWVQQVLLARDVPQTAIHVLHTEVLNTRDEILVVAEQMRSRHLHRVILVTSKQHSRRVRALWDRAATPGLEAIVRPSADDPFDPDDWWHNTEDGQAVLHEIAGLLNVWLGGPLRPERE